MMAILQRPVDVNPSPDDRRNCPARLRSSALCHASARRRRQLDDVVDQILSGRGGRLRASDLAVAVLSRNERFDPHNGPIGRIEIGRLRRDLEPYDAADDLADTIRITGTSDHRPPRSRA